MPRVYSWTAFSCRSVVMFPSCRSMLARQQTELEVLAELQRLQRSEQGRAHKAADHRASAGDVSPRVQHLLTRRHPKQHVRGTDHPKDKHERPYGSIVDGQSPLAPGAIKIIVTASIFDRRGMPSPARWSATSAPMRGSSRTHRSRRGLQRAKQAAATMKNTVVGRPGTTIPTPPTATASKPAANQSQATGRRLRPWPANPGAVPATVIPSARRRDRAPCIVTTTDPPWRACYESRTVISHACSR